SGLGQALATVYLRNNHDVIGTCPQQHHLRDRMVVPGSVSLNYLSLHYEAAQIHGDAEDLLIEHLIRREVLRSFDVVILNAGINTIVPISELAPEGFHHLLHVSAVAPVQLIRQLLLRELIAPGGVVIAITSDAAWRPMTNSMAYCASKAAL